MTRIEHFDATLDSSLRQATNSPHDPDCFWASADLDAVLATGVKPPPCECRRAVKLRVAARAAGSPR